MHRSIPEISSHPLACLSNQKIMPVSPRFYIMDNASNVPEVVALEHIVAKECKDIGYFENTKYVDAYSTQEQQVKNDTQVGQF